VSIKQFKALVAASQHGSFSAAAEALHLTQSAVSMQVNALEKSLGTSLFDRSHRPLHLTASGQIVLAKAREILRHFDGIQDALAETQPYSGVFRLGAVPTTLTNILPRAVMLLTEQEPRLTLNVISGLSGVLAEQVRKSEIDAALISEPTHLQNDLEWSPVARQKIVIVAPPDSTEKDAFDVFKSYPYIRFNRGAWAAPLIENRLAEMGISMDTRAEIESIESICMMVAAGFGASIIPDTGMRVPFSPRLRVLEFGSPPTFRTIGLLSRSNLQKDNALAKIHSAMSSAVGFSGES
jgi:DNA-binding transcriptional LysR family regulator